VNGRPLSVSWLDENVDAILETWFLGVEMGPAVADVLFGDVNPGGKLPVTFPRSVGQIPIYYNHRNTGRPNDDKDPYTTGYIDESIKPLCPFGHGLSYTTFSYSNLRVDAEEIPADGSLRVQVDVSNTGKRTGDEVVQLYIRDVVGSTARPVRELKGFERITLKPGEKRSVSFTLGPDELATFGIDGRWSVEPGDFEVFVGGSSTVTLKSGFSVVGKEP